MWFGWFVGGLAGLWVVSSFTANGRSSIFYSIIHLDGYIVLCITFTCKFNNEFFHVKRKIVDGKCKTVRILKQANTQLIENSLNDLKIRTYQLYLEILSIPKMVFTFLIQREEQQVNICI